MGGKFPLGLKLKKITAPGSWDGMGVGDGHKRRKKKERIIVTDGD